MEGCKDGARCTKRLWVFLLACLPVRASLLALALAIQFRPQWAVSSRSARYALAGVCGLIGAGLVSSYFRKGPAGSGQGFAGGERYWDSLSHGLLYLGFAVAFALEAKGAWIFLVGDLVLALATVGAYYAKD